MKSPGAASVPELPAVGRDVSLNPVLLFPQVLQAPREEMRAHRDDGAPQGELDTNSLI